MSVQRPAGRRTALRLPGAPLFLVIPAVLVAAAMLLPFMYLIVRTSEAGPAIWSFVTRPRTWTVLVNSVLLAASVAVASIAIGVPLAWLLERTDLPGRRLVRALVSVPLAIPSLVGGYSFVASFGAGGIVAAWLGSALGIKVPSVYGFGGAWLVLTLLSYPYVLLPVSASLRNLDPAQEEVAKALGHRPLRVFVQVILPNLGPAVRSGGFLAALYTLSDFSAVSLLQFDSFTRAIYVQYQASLNRSYAAALALMLSLLTLVLIALDTAARQRGNYFRAGAGAKRAAPVVKLGKWRWPALVACTLLILAAVGLPVGVTLYWLIRGVAQGEIVAFPWRATLNSVLVSLAGAALTVAAALPVAVLAVRHRSRVWELIERIAYAGYALPGIVVALSLVFFGARWGGVFYQTIWMLLFAYAVLFLSQALGAIKASLRQVSPNIENVARSLGHSPLRVLFYVTLPVAWSGAKAGGALVFLTVMKELPATLLLSPIGFRALSTEIWASVTEAFYARAAVPSIILVAVSSLSLWIILRENNARGSGRAGDRRSPVRTP